MTEQAETERKSRFDVPRYFRVACHFWVDEKSSKWPDGAKLLAVYLLTNRHRTMEGFYVIPPQYVAADMHWPLRRVRKMLEFLESENFIRFDWERNLLLIMNALRYQQPDSRNVTVGVISRIRTLPDSPKLFQEFCRLARRHCSRRGLSPFAMAFPDMLEKEFGRPPQDCEGGYSCHGRSFKLGAV